MSATATDWRANGICAQTDPDLFFSDKEEDKAAAKKFCAACPSLAPCTVSALANGEVFGIQAGMDEAERRAHPDFQRAGSVFEFAPEDDQKRIDRLVAAEAKALRRRDRAAELRISETPAMDGFDSLTHPADRKAGS
jgi:WhiB family redox-sensing transcriptional regulator